MVKPEPDNASKNEKIHSHVQPPGYSFWGIVLPIMFHIYSSVFFLVSRFTYTGFMVRELVPDSVVLGTTATYTGFLLGTFYLGQAINGMYVGVLSEKMGASFILALTAAAGILLPFLYGFTTQYSSACIVAFLYGMLDGTPALGGAIMHHELTQEDSQYGLGYIGAAWGLVGITAPLASGFLSYPAKHAALDYPTLRMYPFLLPNLICVLLNFISLIIIGSKSFQTWKKSRQQANFGESLDHQHGECKNARGAPSAVVPDSKWNTKPNEKSGPSSSDEKNSQEMHPPPLDCDHLVNDVAEPHSTRGAAASNAQDFELIMTKEEEAELEALREATAQMAPSNTAAIANIINEAPKSFLVHLKTNNSQVFFVLGLCAFLGMISVMVDTLFPMILILSRDRGGFGLGTNGVATIQIAQGIMQTMCSVIVPILTIYHGINRGFWINVLLTIPFIFLIPFYAYIPNKTWGLVLCSLSVAVARQILMQVCFLSICIMINFCVHPLYVGHINGLSVVFSSVFRFLGPSISSALFAWPSSGSLSFPFNQHFAFCLYSLIALALSITAWKFLRPEREMPVCDVPIQQVLQATFNNMPGADKVTVASFRGIVSDMVQMDASYSFTSTYSAQSLRRMNMSFRDIVQASLERPDGLAALAQI